MFALSEFKAATGRLQVPRRPRADATGASSETRPTGPVPGVSLLTAETGARPGKRALPD